MHIRTDPRHHKHKDTDQSMDPRLERLDPHHLHLEPKKYILV
jgi:hypothetical protein